MRGGFEDGVRHYVGDECHDAQVGVERAKGGYGGFSPHAAELEHGDGALLGFLLDGVVGASLAVGRAEDADYGFAAVRKGGEYVFAKGCLANYRYSHIVRHVWQSPSTLFMARIYIISRATAIWGGDRLALWGRLPGVGDFGLVTAVRQGD